MPYLHEFRILGPIEVVIDGRTVALAGTRQRALLAILLLHAGEVVSADRLIDELWGERPPDGAANTLQATVSRLRKLLHAENGSHLLVTRPPGYVLEIAPDQLDLRRFEQLVSEGRDALRAGDADRASETLRAALSLWRGPALGDLDLGPAVRTAVARLEDARLEALELWIDADLELGQHAALVGELEALVAAHRYRETFRRQLMLALYRSGRQTEALEVYRATRRLLADELGLEPSEPLRELHAAMLRQDPVLLPPKAAPSPGARASRRHAPLLVGALLLLGAIAVVAAVARGHDHSGLAAIPPRSVGRIDPATNRIAAAVPIGQRPAAIAVGHGSVWVANTNDATVVRIDARTTKAVRTLAVPGHPTSLAVDAGSVWARNGVEHTVVRIDPAFNSVGRPIGIGPERLPAPDFVPGIAAGRGSVWVAAPPTDVVRIDDRTQRLAARFTLDGAALGPIAYGAGRLWVGGGSTLSEVQVETRQRIAPIPLIGDPTAIVAARASVWVAVYNKVQEIDARSHTPLGTVDLPGRVTAIAVGEASVWAATGSTVFRIDRERRVAAKIGVGRSVSAIAAGDGAVWVGVG